MEPTEPEESVVDSDVGEALATAAMAVARRFARGATLWCIAPEWPEHARHVAVEFVHPVLVGKRGVAGHQRRFRRSRFVTARTRSPG